VKHSAVLVRRRECQPRREHLCTRRRHGLRDLNAQRKKSSHYLGIRRLTHGGSNHEPQGHTTNAENTQQEVIVPSAP
jgi:hypothetical protein